MLKAGTILDGKYRLIRRLGTGSTGAVWLTRDENNVNFACKILHSHLADSRSIMDRLRREADILSRLAHRGIPKHVQTCLDTAPAYLVIEYIDGEPLHEVIGRQSERQEDFSGTWIRNIFAQLCDALTYAHAENIVHRDVKPQNIMLVDAAVDPKLKVLDFGHARLLEGSIFDATTFGRALGSPLYMSPEQARGHPATIQSDVFALATVLYELVTLHRAWVRKENDGPLPAFSEPVPPAYNGLPVVLDRIRNGRRPSVQGVRPKLPAEFDRLFERALAIEPSKRPATVDAFRAAAWPLLSALTDPPPAVAPIAAAGERSSPQGIETSTAEFPVRDPAAIAGPERAGPTVFVPYTASAPAAEGSSHRSRDFVWAIIVATAGVLGLAIGASQRACQDAIDHRVLPAATTAQHR